MIDYPLRLLFTCLYRTDWFPHHHVYLFRYANIGVQSRGTFSRRFEVYTQSIVRNIAHPSTRTSNCYCSKMPPRDYSAEKGMNYDLLKAFLPVMLIDSLNLSFATMFTCYDWVGGVMMLTSIAMLFVDYTLLEYFKILVQNSILVSSQYYVEDTDDLILIFCFRKNKNISARVL